MSSEAPQDLPILSELSQRRVFRTLAVYVALAWASIEIALTVLDRLGAPEWIGTALVILFIAGFPLVTLAAWLFDIEGGRIKRVGTGRMSVLAGTLAVATLASAGAAIVYTSGFAPVAAPQTSSLVRFEDVRIRPITAQEGFEAYPSISPDGRYVAYSQIPGPTAEADIWVQEIDSGQTQILERPGYYNAWPAWSPDGARVAFISNRFPNPDAPEQTSGFSSEIVTRTIVGDRETSVADLDQLRVTRPANLDWSSDGRWFALNGHLGEVEANRILLISALDGSVRALPHLEGEIHDHEPRWSPDATRLAFVRSTPNGNRVCIYALETDAVSCLTPEGESWPAQRIAWLPDSRTLLAPFGLVLAARQMAQIDTETGEVSAAPFGRGADYLSVARETGRIVIEEYFEDHDIWRFPGPAGDGTTEAEPLITSTRSDVAPRYSPDGEQVLFMSTRSGAWEVWVANADGSDAYRVTDTGFASFGRWFPDAGRITFSSAFEAGSDPLMDLRDNDDPLRIYSIDVRGGIPLLEHGDAEISALAPSLSADGEWLIFNRGPFTPCGLSLWKKHRSTGELLEVGNCLRRPEEGENGRLFALDGNGDIASVDADGGDLRLELPFQSENRAFEDPSGWTIWQGQVVFLDQRDRTIRIREGGEDRILARLNPDAVRTSQPQLSVSPDGRWVLHDVLEKSGSDVVVIDWNTARD